MENDFQPQSIEESSRSNLVEKSTIYYTLL